MSGLSQSRYLFGIHSFTPFNRTTGKFYTEAKVLAGSQFVLTGEQLELRGGSSKYPFAIEDGTINAELVLKSREYPSWAFELFLGKSLTEGTTELSGNVSALTNVKGTSIFDAATGIDSIAGSVIANLKFGRYVIEASGAEAVNIYAASDIDFARGTNTVFEDDTMLINASPLTIVTGGASTAVPNYGMDIVGGSGTIAFVVGDTASFEVRPVNAGYYSADFGGSSDSYPEFGAVVYAQQAGGAGGKMFEIVIHKLKAIGMPINFDENTFSEFEISMKASYDSAKNQVFSIREVIF